MPSNGSLVTLRNSVKINTPFAILCQLLKQSDIIIVVFLCPAPCSYIGHVGQLQLDRIEFWNGPKGIRTLIHRAYEIDKNK